MPLIPDSTHLNDGLYFAVNFLDAGQLCQDSTQESDMLQQNLDRMAKGSILMTDARCEDRQLNIHKVMRRQQRGLCGMQNKQRVTFSNRTIYNSDMDDL